MTSISRARRLLALSLAVLSPACGSPSAPRRDAGAATDAAASGGCAEDLMACAYPALRLETTCRDEAGLPASARPMDRSAPSATYHRTVPLRVCHPVGGGPYPFVLFEHGGGLRAGGQNESVAWARVIASQGYVVVRVGHPEADATSAAALCAASGASVDACTADPEIVHTVARPTDLVAALDALPDVAAALTAAGRPTGDPSRVALAGWSGGTQGPAALFGAVREVAPGARYTLTDARPLAIALLSPSGPGFHHFFERGADHSWVQLRGPVLVLTGENDVKPDLPELTGPLRRRPHELAPADGSRRLLYSRLPVGVGGHGTFNLGDAESPDPRLVRLSAAIASTLLAFLDAQVKHDAAAAAYLASDRPRLLAGDADYLTR
ncbi:MAG: hypothetical protein R3A48_22890 [Polyangiales bacterium]